jgi:hypothetical protein
VFGEPTCCPLAHAQTNFPLSTYERVLGTLDAHSDDAVVAALRKDARLACCRTSK